MLDCCKRMVSVYIIGDNALRIENFLKGHGITYYTWKRDENRYIIEDGVKKKCKPRIDISVQFKNCKDVKDFFARAKNLPDNHTIVTFTDGHITASYDHFLGLANPEKYGHWRFCRHEVA